MSERARPRGKEFAKDLTKAVAKSIPVGVGLGVSGVIGITARSHRERTHKSLELPAPIQKGFDLEERSIGMDTSIWAAVHRIHHAMTDASLYPFYRVVEALEWKLRNPAQAAGIEIPGHFAGFDYFVPKFTLSEVVEIGDLAKKEVVDRLGSAYREPDFTVEQVGAILNPEGPQYTYPEPVEKGAEYSQDEIARILLTDPHSPLLMAEGNGVRGVLRKNVGLYKATGNLFKARPDLKPADLQSQDQERRHPTRDVLAGFGLAGAVTYLARGKFKPEDILIAAAAGSAANGIKMGTAVIGGNVTNSFGHMGAVLHELRKAAFSKEYTPTLNMEDGSVATDTVMAGLLGKALSILTFDEVGGQKVHHDHPEKIAYTHHQGRQAWIDAPWGSLLKKAAEKGFLGIREGSGFGPGKRRPDTLHPGTRRIQEIRLEHARTR